MASARDLHINENYITWMKNVVDSVVMSHLTQTYNTLGNKIYEHKARHEAELKALREQHESRIASLEQVLMEQAVTNSTLLKDLEVLNGNNQVLTASLRSLREEITVLKEGANLAQFAPRGSPRTGTTESKQRPKVADPPKYKGNKSDLTLEQWLQKLGIWFRYQNITSDEDKITAALMFIEGGVQSFMDDYAQNAANGAALGTW